MIRKFDAAAFQDPSLWGRQQQHAQAYQDRRAEGGRSVRVHTVDAAKDFRDLRMISAEPEQQRCLLERCRRRGLVLTEGARGSRMRASGPRPARTIYPFRATPTPNSNQLGITDVTESFVKGTRCSGTATWFPSGYRWGQLNRPAETGGSYRICQASAHRQSVSVSNSERGLSLTPVALRVGYVQCGRTQGEGARDGPATTD